MYDSLFVDDRNFFIFAFIGELFFHACRFHGNRNLGGFSFLKDQFCFIDDDQSS